MLRILILLARLTFACSSSNCNLGTCGDCGECVAFCNCAR